MEAHGSHVGINLPCGLRDIFEPMYGKDYVCK